MSLKLTLVIWLFLLLVGRAAGAQEADEPGIQPLPAPPHRTLSRQALDPEAIEVVEITPLPDGPSAVPTLLQIPSRPRRGPFFTLEAGASYGGYAMIFAEAVSGPLVTTSLAMTFGGGRARHGLRLGGYYGLMSGRYEHLFEEDGGDAETRLYGVNLGYMLQVGGFWLSAGWGAVHVNSRLDSGREETTLPEGVLALGYDIRLGEHLGLRLGGEMGTFFVSWRGQLGGSLVLRF